MSTAPSLKLQLPDLDLELNILNRVTLLRKFLPGTHLATWVVGYRYKSKEGDYR